jgi:hypothetical protein
MAGFLIELLHRAAGDSDHLLAERQDIHAPDLASAVVHAGALFLIISSGKPSLVTFRIIENGLIAYEATKGELG